MSDAPFSISVELPESFGNTPSTLALGGELKSSICLIRGAFAYITEAIGDLEQEAVYRHFASSLEQILAEQSPDRIVIDLHPDYLSAQLGQRLSAEMKLPLFRVQHHHAHIAAVMADNGLPPDAKPVLGLALDGLGFGGDGTIWGGECLLADYHGFHRVGHFQPVAMIGGAAAIHEPWRNTLAYLLPIWDEVSRVFSDTDIMRFLAGKPVAMMQHMVATNLNTPLASSCGRLFDGVAAALGLHRDNIAFEAQAAIALEQAASSCFESETGDYSYGTSHQGGSLQLEWQPMWLALLQDIQDGVDTGIIAARFHRTLIHALGATAISLCNEYGSGTVALSGGVFQNRLISTCLPQLLQQSGLTVLQHHNTPAHDGGLCLGQAAIASAIKGEQQ